MASSLLLAPSRAAKTLRTMCVTTFGLPIGHKGQHRAEIVGEPKGGARPVGMPGLDRRLRAERRRREGGLNDSLNRRAPASAGLVRPVGRRPLAGWGAESFGCHGARVPQPAVPVTAKAKESFACR
jgi:hypothetical protein